MENFTYTKGLKLANISYLGATRHSAKMGYSYQNGVETYCVYLAPATMARDDQHMHINVCSHSSMCRENCLNGAGRNRGDIIKNGIKHSNINKARVKKTHLFYDDRETFMQLLIHEIEKYQQHAKRNNMQFAIRLNGTSDLSPTIFKYNGKNILELFPNVQFYDYTKVPNRLKLQSQYPNYDITFSFDGSNWDICEEYLKNGGKVAVVFDMEDEYGKQTLPQYYKGFKVIDANLSDDRFNDECGCIMGLHYHRTANDYQSGKYITPQTPFIVRG